MDIDGGENYEEMGSSQLYAVPYALYADEAGKLREQQDQSKPVSSSENKTGFRSNRMGKQGGSRNGDPNSKIPATGNGFLNANSGNLGVGITSPVEKLDVNGNIRISGSLLADDGIILRDSKGNPQKVTINPDGTWTSKFHCEGYMKDLRDGRQYNIIQIGRQCWMAENFNGGIRIDKSVASLNNSLIEKYCYDDLETKCDTFGGLYQWDELMNYFTVEGAQGICPESWHVPADWEWKILEGSVDDVHGIGDPVWDLSGWRGTDAGEKLKSTSGWHLNGNGTDDYGFTALPAGYIDQPGATYYGITEDAAFWTSKSPGSFAISRISNWDQIKHLSGNTTKSYGLSLRCVKDFKCGDSIYDYRDEKRYGTVEIGDQCWMSQNLNVGTRIDGINDQQDNPSIEKYCYNDNEDKCDTLGGLYQWNEAMQYVITENAQGICPDGWHIPAFVELENLADFLGGWDFAGGKMKSTGTTDFGTGLWDAPNTGATNMSGFTGLPGGVRNASDGSFATINELGRFWITWEQNSTQAWFSQLSHDGIFLSRSYVDKDFGHSVRCIKN